MPLLWVSCRFPQGPRCTQLDGGLPQAVTFTSLPLSVLFSQVCRAVPPSLFLLPKGRWDWTPLIIFWLPFPHWKPLAWETMLDYTQSMKIFETERRPMFLTSIIVSITYFAILFSFSLSIPSILTIVPKNSWCVSRPLSPWTLIF